MAPASAAFIDQEWDKLRAKLLEVSLPQGARQPFLNTDFGNTVTLLFALTSPPITDAECVARANLIRDQLAELRGAAPLTNRAAVIAFFPPGVAQSYRESSANALKPRSVPPTWPTRFTRARASRLFWPT